MVKFTPPPTPAPPLASPPAPPPDAAPAGWLADARGTSRSAAVGALIVAEAEAKLGMAGIIKVRGLQGAGS